MALIELAVVSGAVAAGIGFYRRQHTRKTLVEILVEDNNPAPIPLAVISRSALLIVLRDFFFFSKLPNPANTGGEVPLYAGSIFTDLPTMIAQNRKDLVLASIAAVLAGCGSLGLPWLTWLSVPFLIYLSVPLMRQGYMQLVVQRQLGMDVIGAVIHVGILSMGLFFADAIFILLYSLTFSLLFATYDATRRNLTSILADLPPEIWVRQGQIEMRIPLEQARVGDIIVVHAGEVIPIDGTIIAGMASVDQRVLTGESQPVEKEVGDTVFAATQVLSGSIDLIAERIGADTVAGNVGAVLLRTTDYVSTLDLQGRRLGDRAVVPLLTLGALSLPGVGPVRALAILLAPCGEGMMLLSPVSVLTFLRIASDHSILVKDGRALEVLARVDTVVFDKTGTLTHEQPHVAAIHPCPGFTVDEVLRYAAAAETYQSHPIARAIWEAAHAQSLAIPSTDDTSYVPGYGLIVEVEGCVVHVGSARFLHMEGILLPLEMQAHQAVCHARGHTLVYVAVNRHIAGALELHATIRPEAAQIVQALRQRGLTMYIISGDHEEPTRHLAEQLGIDHYFAEVLPEDKSRLVAHLQNTGRTVCFVGDGINDAIALKQAHVGVSLHGATTIAIDTAEVILLDASLQQLDRLFALAQDLNRNMKVNMALSIIPGVVIIGGVFFLKFGVVTAAVSNVVWLTIGLGNAVYPGLEHSIKRLSTKVQACNPAPVRVSDHTVSPRAL